MVKGWCFVVLFLLLMPLVFSLENVNTQITVKTDPNVRVWLIIKDQSTMRTIGTFNTTVDDSGEKVLNYGSTERMLAFTANVYQDNLLTNTEDFSGFMAGDAVVLDTNVEGAPVENATEETQNESVVDESAANDTAGVTGNVVSEGGIDMNMVYYIGGGILLAAIIVFVVYNVIQRRVPSSFTVTKLSTKLEQEGKSAKVYSDDKELKAAERKLEEMQGEIDRLKRVKDAERKFDEAKKELDNLRKG